MEEPLVTAPSTLEQPASEPETDATATAAPGPELVLSAPDSDPAEAAAAEQDQPEEQPDLPAAEQEAVLPDPAPVAEVEPEPETPPEPPQVATQLEQVLQLLTNRLQYDETKEKIIDRQHHELVKFRSGVQDELLRPVLRGIVDVVIDIDRTKQFLGDAEERVGKELDYVSAQLLELLDANLVEQFTSAVGEPLDAGKHSLQKTVPTADQTLRGTIAQSLTPGFFYKATTLTKERVAVYKYVPANTPTEA